MTDAMDDHLSFWEALRAHLWVEKKSFLDGFEILARDTADSPFGPVCEAVAKDLRSGSGLAEAMEKHRNVFSESVLSMVRAGEAGGLLDAITDKVLAGLRDGSLHAPGVRPAPETDLFRFWRGFGHLLSSGVPILTALETLEEGMCGTELKEAARAMVRTLLEGETLSHALRDYPDLFPGETVGLVEEGETEGTLDEKVVEIASGLEKGGPADGAATDEPVPEGAMSGAVKLVNLLLADAIRARATDIHIDVFETGPRVRIRVDGVLKELAPPPPDLAKAVVPRIKVMANLDVGERRLPQHGRIQVEWEGRHLDLRVGTVPTLFGERVTLRILDRTTVRIDLADIIEPEEKLAALRKLADLPYGLVVVSGPTGSGKTTTLYGLVKEANRAERSVLSVEDPVEYAIDGVAQIPVDTRVGFTFARAIKAALFQDPDVVMVGEIRDAESMDLVLKVAMTGHLVFTQMHTRNAAETVHRVGEIARDAYLVSASLKAVVAQRLVRLLCAKCRRPAPETGLPAQARAYLSGRDLTGLREAEGCDACQNTGYRGRAAIHEVLEVDDAVRAAVAQGAGVEALHGVAVDQGMKTLQQDGLDLALAGRTSVSEVLRVVPL